MAASGAFALEKEVHSESHVLTASCRGLTTFFSGALAFFRVTSVAFFVSFFVRGFNDPNYLVVL